ncbi:MAG: triose-phosphate isomerase [Candidatus Woesearchaeota archaeon]
MQKEKNKETKFFCGNWKMHKTSKEALDYLKKFIPLISDVKHEIVLAVPFTLLPVLKTKLKNSNVKLAAQNIFYENQGAFTGEISPLMVKEYAYYVIIGHSERRQYFNETDEIINKKIKAALNNQLKLIFCVGETYEQRAIDETNLVIERQILNGLKGLNSENLKNIIIAYEPVWAIGTGKVALPEQAEEVHSFIKSLIKKNFNLEIKVIYGGSVNPENSTSLLKMPNIDGCLPGGSSLEPETFAKIIKSV